MFGVSRETGTKASQTTTGISELGANEHAASQAKNRIKHDRDQSGRRPSNDPRSRFETLIRVLNTNARSDVLRQVSSRDPKKNRNQHPSLGSDEQKRIGQPIRFCSATGGLQEKFLADSYLSQILLSRAAILRRCRKANCSKTRDGI